MRKISLTLTPDVKKFFESYEKNVNGFGPAHIATQYGDSLMIAMPKGAYPFKHGEFLKILPNRKQFFEDTGLKASHIVSLKETSLGRYYVLVTAVWNFHFEKTPGKPLDIRASTTYILRKSEHSLQIVFQLDHEDLTELI